ncbi:sensor histidine kinase [Piscinibacter sakaiensis]|uniref:sensor histidine kinase n=1 Tax=Piscinibacter sakaiensis TaxID=1547922 RepID=UPI003AAFD8D5
MPLQQFRQWSIRAKLLAMVLLPLLVVLPLLGLILLLWGNAALDRMLITKVRSDLAVANGYFERVLGEVRSSAAAIADSHALHRTINRVGSGDAAADDLVRLLQGYKARERVDFINLRRVDGELLVTDSGVATASDRGSAAFAAAVNRGGSAGIEILQPAELALLAPAFQSTVSVDLLPTRNAAPTERSREDRAMVLLASEAIVDADGEVVGQVQAGLLLNRNLPFIDHINEIVYPDGSLPFGSRGTATLFLDDVRISTNVRLFGTDPSNPLNPASRAIGTRVSQNVRDAVLGRGATWLDRAFVVNDWYVSAYQPLTDGSGERVGMLYVGYLERPFSWLKYAVLASIGVVFFIVMIGAAVVSMRGARAIFKPLEQMAETMRRVGSGELGARVGPVEQRDEIGQLAGHLDQLLDTIRDKTEALQRLNSELDAKVAQRTAALEAAQGQLLRSEKLAAVGQLTASIAHEVNNPIAVIQGNLDLINELLDADSAARIRTELELMNEQVERMRLLVTKLLQFARPTEYAGYVEPIDLGETVDDCLVLVGHLMATTRIELQRDFRATERVAINRQELQQVIVNLLVNAIQAMPAGGTLRLVTRDWGSPPLGAEFEITDDGPGLDPDLLTQLFQAFVTRRRDGTGLGLWISHSIVERYGGQIEAANRDDGQRGAVFRVRLRSEPEAAA